MLVKPKLLKSIILQYEVNSITVRIPIVLCMLLPTVDELYYGTSDSYK